MGENVFFIECKVEIVINLHKAGSVNADYHYAKIRSFLENQGIPIGPNDLLIATHARAEDLIIVTANFSEFNRVPDLVVENWLQNEK